MSTLNRLSMCCQTRCVEWNKMEYFNWMYCVAIRALNALFSTEFMINFFPFRRPLNKLCIHDRFRNPKKRKEEERKRNARYLFGTRDVIGSLWGSQIHTYYRQFCVREIEIQYWFHVKFNVLLPMYARYGFFAVRSMGKRKTNDMETWCMYYSSSTINSPE